MLGDIELVKAAVLYADRVEIVGLAATMVHGISASQGSTTALDLLPDLVEGDQAGDGMPKNWREILPAVRRLVKYEGRLAEELASSRDQMAEFFQETDRLWNDARRDVLDAVRGHELIPALDSGVIEIADLGIGAREAVLSAMGKVSLGSGVEVERWLAVVKRRLADGRSRLLFDEASGDLIQTMLDEGVIQRDETGLRLASAAAVGAGLVARLPTFTAAPLDELLDLRSDLSASLVQYRGAVLRFSKTLSGSLGGHQGQEVDELWEAEAAPAIAEIKALLRDHSLVRELARHATADIKSFVGWTGGFYLGISAVTNLNDMVTATLAAVPEGAQLARDVAYGRRDAVAEARHRELFMLYEANRRLKGK